jgi:hypothetical protein
MSPHINRPFFVEQCNLLGKFMLKPEKTGGKSETAATKWIDGQMMGLNTFVFNHMIDYVAACRRPREAASGIIIPDTSTAYQNNG